jgi:hypothetical protein
MRCDVLQLCIAHLTMPTMSSSTYSSVRPCSRSSSLTARIQHYNRQLEALAQEHYPETKLLGASTGCRDAYGFDLRAHPGGSRTYQREPAGGRLLGLVPSGDRSGEHDPQKRISREGDELF